jgi:recombination protein RecT
MSDKATTPVQTDNAPAKAENNAVATVSKLVRSYIEKGTLHLPLDYSADNALKSAWLALQEVKDRDGRPALMVCTPASVNNALLDMVVQGLNPAKRQCYFIVYGNQLTCQRSYFGDQALATRIRPGIEIYSGIVYEGDGFEYESFRGRMVVTKHKQTLENRDNAKIRAAYCGIVDTNGEDLGAVIMTIAEIKKSWGMSKTYNPSGSKGTHHDFPDQMCLRTVIRRRCKPIINTSTDELLMASVRRQEMDSIDAEVEEEVEANANGEVLALAASSDAAPVPAVSAPQPESAPVGPGQTSLGPEAGF